MSSSAREIVVELTLQEVAKLLNVSQDFVVKLAAQGEVSGRRRGATTVFLESEVLSYKERDDAARLAAADELATEAQEFGFYG